MRTKQPPKDFDLPKHLFSEPGHIPHKSKAPDLIELRKRHAPGELVARQERHGLFIASALLRGARASQDNEVLRYARERSAMCLLGSAWHGYAQGASWEGRRRLKLPDFTTLDYENLPDSDTMTIDAIHAVDEAVPQSSFVISEIAKKKTGTFSSEELARRKFGLGQKLGNAALVLATAEIGDTVSTSLHLPKLDVQAMVKRACLAFEQTTLDFSNQVIHQVPSLALLAEYDGPLAVNTRNTMPAELYQSYTQMIEQLHPV